MRLLRLAAGLALMGCVGVIDEPPPFEGWTPPPITFEEGSVDFVCPADASPIDAPLRRLSRAQLENTLQDVLRDLLADEAGTVLDEVAPALSGLPDDLRQDHAEQPGQLLFFRSDQGVGPSAVEAHYRIAVALGASLTRPARLEAMGFACMTNADAGDDAACINDLVRRVGALTHRRPINESEFAFYRNDTYASGDTVDLPALGDVVTVLFAQPHFIFHAEGTGDLDAYEAANRLSYHFWDTMPDAELRESAASGALLTDEGWNAQVQRLVDDERVRESVRSFVNEWLRFDQINPASSGAGADFDAIAGDLALDEGFDAAVEDELVDLFLYVMRSGGTFEDFFLAEVTPTQHPVLASIYGVEPAAAGEVVAVPAERKGIMTRVGLLLARAIVALPNINSITHPILRGVFVRRQIVCDNLPEAPGGAMDNLPVVDRSVTGSRQATTLLTGSSGCSGCHARINSAGYALESFDAIGQLRSEEPLFDADGEETMRLPIDDSAEILESESPVAGGAELAQTLYDSEKVSACFSRHYVRFALGRSERTTEDGCILASLDEAIDEGRPLREVLALVVLDPAFRVRGGN